MVDNLQEQFSQAQEYGKRGFYDRAEETYRELLKNLAHTSALYHPVRYNLSWFDFRRGNIAGGARARVESGRVLDLIIDASRMYPKPRLTNDHDIRGKTILLSHEGGAGDEILSARFAKTLKERGVAKVIWVSPNNLQSVLSRVEGVDHCIVPEEAEHFQYDAWALTLDLPFILDASQKDIQRGAYLTPHPAYVEKWRQKLKPSTNLKVGARWRGETSRDLSQARALPLAFLEKLLNLPGVDAYSLQRDEGHEKLSPNSVLIDWGKDLETWEDTAGAIANLDIVITSCTSIAHLAAAMGKETWVVCRPFCYFPWASLDDRHSYWYDSARIFREPIESHWEVPFARMQAELHSLLETRKKSGTEERGQKNEEIVKVSMLGNTMKMHIHPEGEFHSEIIRRRGWYSERDLILYDLLLDEGDTFFDLGASLGWYSLYAAQKVGSTGKVIAVEPEDKNYAILVKNIALNTLPQIESVRKAIGDSEGVMRLYRSELNTGDHFVAGEAPPEIEGRERRESVEVSVITIDSLVEKYGVPRLIKLDIQGAEPAALRGMEKALAAKKKPILLLEFSPGLILRAGSAPLDIISFIDKEGFVPYHVFNDDVPPGMLLEPVSPQRLLDFIEEHRSSDIGWDLLLIHKDQFSEVAARLNLQ